MIDGLAIQTTKVGDAALMSARVALSSGVVMSSLQQKLHREHRARQAKFFPKAPAVPVRRFEAPPVEPKRLPAPATIAAVALSEHLLPAVIIVSAVEAPGEYRIYPTIQTVIRAAAQHFGIKRSRLTGPSRKRDVVQPRHIAMFIAKTKAKTSLPEIGRRFGGRDHTTALHAIRKIENLKTRDAEIAKSIAAIAEELDRIIAEAGDRIREQIAERKSRENECERQSEKQDGE